MRRPRRRSECQSGSPSRTHKPDRQIPGDIGDVSVLRIDPDNPLGAGLGQDQGHQASAVRRGMSPLTDDRTGVLILLLVRLKLREDIDQFANATARQRLAGVQQRIVVDDPGLSLR